MNSAYLLRAGALVVGLLCHPVVTSGQEINGDAGADGPWHAARQARSVSQDSASGDQLLRAAALEFSLKRLERARTILASSDELVAAFPDEFRALLGAVEYESGAFEQAALLFRDVGTSEGGWSRAIAVARAGDAFERAGMRERAAEYYRLAAELVPHAAPWFAFREARVVSDTARVSALLERVPPERHQQSLMLWADRLRDVGDTITAISAYVGAGQPGTAARLSLAVGDIVEARRLAYRALAVSDTAVRRAGLRVVTLAASPRTIEELIDVARAYESLGDRRAAVRFAELALDRDSISPSAYEYLGDLLDGPRQRQRAAAMYARAAAAGGPAAASPAYKRARVLFRLNRPEGAVALQEFASRYPKDRRAPLALYLVADWARDRRRHRMADSLFEVISERWPRDTYASRARFDVAARHLVRGDTAGAVELYGRESRAGGLQRRPAEYFLAALRAGQGDSLEARGMWAALARADSLGYYGMIARTVAGLPPMVIEPAAPVSPSSSVVATLALLDLFRAAKFLEEEEALLEGIRSRETVSAAELLDLAEGLIERGRTVEGVRLGWRAAGALTLNHPRVLRVIFPWPLRKFIEAEAREFDVDPYMIAGLIRQESAFRVEVVSHAGAHGLMQLMPPTARDVARRLGVEWDRSLLHVADANLHFGVSHFASLLRRYDGDVIPTLAAYNAGSTPVRRWLRFPEAGDPVRFIERIPYQETRNYLKTVLRNHALYRALYPPQSIQVDGLQ